MDDVDLFIIFMDVENHKILRGSINANPIYLSYLNFSATIHDDSRIFATIFLVFAYYEKAFIFIVMGCYDHDNYSSDLVRVVVWSIWH